MSEANGDTPSKWPNLEMLARGCASGRFSEWPGMRAEAERILTALHTTEAALAEMKAEREVFAENISYLLDNTLSSTGCVVRVREAGGPESLGQSLAVTVSKVAMKLTAAEQRASAAEGDNSKLREALGELVRLKELKASIGANNTDAEDEYERCKPLAWDRARALAKS